MKTFLIFLLLLSPLVFAEHEEHSGMDHSEHASHKKNRGKVFLIPSDCGESEIWDSVTAMCMPYPMGHEMSHLMIHGNIFATGIAQSGPRGEDAIVSTQMLMGNLGRTLGEHHFVNLGLMVTGEKWTLPAKGYPLILQTGESNHDGYPYIDAQHPHSSPIMGITLSDTIRLGESSGKNYLKFFFAPRGQSTDGPITFMHRPTGVLHPDAPLGHHLGQDVGHISSTVIGGIFKWKDTQVEASAFNGEEPEPEEVDLPMGSPNSGAARLIQFFTPDLFAMASVAYVKSPHPHGHVGSAPPSFDETISDLFRYSASVYGHFSLGEGWETYQTLIYGSIRTFGVDTSRHSFSYEFSVKHSASTIFSRTEVLERMPAELSIASLTSLEKYWVVAATLGYSHLIWDFTAIKLNLGASVTKSFMPSAFSAAYDGNPWSGKIFLQLSGMDMW